MLGVGDAAEDTLQETFLRRHGTLADDTRVRNPSQLLRATTDGDLAALVATRTEDGTLRSDGGTDVHPAHPGT